MEVRVLDDKEFLQIGELYRELRLARGLKLKDVANQQLSLSQLSKFENGQTMIAADQLLVALSGIHMSLAEFGHALNHYQESPFFSKGKQIAMLQLTGDVDGLKALIHDVANTDVYTRLNAIDVASAIQSLDPVYAISEADKAFLTDYLYSIEEWTEYELYLFGNTMSILSSKDLIFLGKAFAERDSFYQTLPQHRKTAELIFLNIMFALIERRELHHIPYFMEKLEALLTYQDMFALSVLTFLRQVLDYLNGSLVSVTPIKDYIDMVKKVGNPTLADLLIERLAAFGLIEKI